MCPKVEGDGGEFIYDRLGEAGFGEVDGLNVSAANVAALHANMRKSPGCIYGKLGVVLVGAGDAPELPLGQTETAKQAALPAVAHRTEHTADGVAAAQRTKRGGIAFELQRDLRADELSAGLKKSKGKEVLR